MFKYLNLLKKKKNVLLQQETLINGATSRVELNETELHGVSKAILMHDLTVVQGIESMEMLI